MTIIVINPSTGEVIDTRPADTPVALDAAVQAARRALPEWSAAAAVRSKALEDLAAVLTDHATELARTLSLETGIPIKDARLEVTGAAAFISYRARTQMAEDVLHDDERQQVVLRRRPIGVVGAILPWNAPLLIMAEKIASAFAAGNAVVVKASPLAPLTVLQFTGLLRETLPSGVLTVLVGDFILGNALVEHPDVGMISFTGSTRAGRQIMAAAAPRLKRLSLELGGNDAAIVLPDVDVAKVAPKLFLGAQYRSGQICAAIKRLYVHRDIYAPMVDALASIASSVAVGDPFEEGVLLGPLSNWMQRDRVAGLVREAREAGARVVTGGHVLDRAGSFYAPTIVSDIAPDLALVTKEQFGPALPVLPFDDPAAAVAAANDSDYGLGASVWATDTAAAVELAAGLDAGSVWVNRHGIVAPDVPFGGTKQSGVGRANGTVGVDAYSELTTVSVALNRPAPAV